jgi:glucose/mannose transport system substrate-binding protein
MEQRRGRGVVSRRRLLAGAGSGVAALTAGCVNDTSTPSPTRRSPDFVQRPLEVLHGWTSGDGGRAIDAVEQMFRARYPDVSIDLRRVGGTGNENLNSAIDRRLASGNPPSSFAAWPGPNLTQYEGQLVDVTPVWEGADFEDSIHPRVAEYCHVDGAYRAVPIGSHRVNNLFYNATLLDRADVDPSTLTSVSAFVDALDAVATRTDAVPLAHAMQAPWTNLQLFASVLLGQVGEAGYGRFVDGEGDRKAVRGALETTRTLLTYVNDDAASISFTDANEKLLQGRAAFISQGSWVYGMYSDAESFAYGSNWGWRAFPGTDGLYLANLDAFTFPADNPTPAKKDVWARFVGEPDPQIAFSNRKGSVPVRTDFDSDRLAVFPRLVWRHLTGDATLVPTLAHGLAVPPPALAACKGVVADHFMDSYDVGATTDGLLAALSS